MRSISIHSHRVTRATGGVLVVLALVAACSATVPSGGVPSGAVPGEVTTSNPPAGDSSADSAETTAAAAGEGGDLAVLPGTGTYAIGAEAPLGGYRLAGDGNGLPAGCSWAIKDADGETFNVGDGTYAFLTDIREAVTFVTEGCPDWEQFD